MHSELEGLQCIILSDSDKSGNVFFFLASMRPKTQAQSKWLGRFVSGFGFHQLYKTKTLKRCWWINQTCVQKQTKNIFLCVGMRLLLSASVPQSQATVTNVSQQNNNDNSINVSIFLKAFRLFTDTLHFPEYWFIKANQQKAASLLNRAFLHVSWRCASTFHKLTYMKYC